MTASLDYFKNDDLESQPGTRTFLYLRPTQGTIIALMTNMDGAACEELVPKILEAIK